MTFTIGRRKFLAALSGAVVAWPLAAHAPQQPSMPASRPRRATAHRAWPGSAKLKRDWLRRWPDLLPAHLVRSQAGV
jgi:hypothetical protein